MPPLASISEASLAEPASSPVPLSAGPASTPESAAGGPASEPAPDAATQVWVVGSQTGVAGFVQSGFVLQPPAGSHVPLSLHAPERHTIVPPSDSEHGPSPLAYPHLLSFGSHTPLWQTSAPAAAVHVPFSVGFVCGGSLGIAVPFGSCALHVLTLMSHHMSVAQSASVLQPVGGSQVPFTLHMPERHTTPPLPAPASEGGVHGPSPVA